MTFPPQHIVAPDGTELVVITRRDYERLTTRAGEDKADIAAAEQALAEMREAGGGMPGAVLDLILDERLSPIAAWRRHRGMSQAELARRTGMAQTAISRLERLGAGAGRAKTRYALAEALDAPLWTLDPAS